MDIRKNVFTVRIVKHWNRLDTSYNKGILQQMGFRKKFSLEFGFSETSQKSWGISTRQDVQSLSGLGPEKANLT